MQKIAIVAETDCYYLISIKSFLTAGYYQVLAISADMDAISQTLQNWRANSILIFADAELLKRQSALLFVKDIALMHGIPIFASGSQKELSALQQIIPKELIRLEFLRPLKKHMSEVVAQIDAYLKQYYTNSKKKILVVDDSGPMLRTVKGWLENKYDVFLVNSAARAIKYLVINRPDLILLDYEMPVVDGKQVLEMIRTETDFTNVPVMFLTAKEDKESFMKVQYLNPEGYLLKSAGPAVIVKAVDDFFEMQKAML